MNSLIGNECHQYGSTEEDTEENSKSVKTADTDQANYSEIMESVSRVYPVKFARDLFIRGSVIKAKFWTLGFVSSGVKTIVFMAAYEIIGSIIH